MTAPLILIGLGPPETSTGRAPHFAGTASCSHTSSNSAATACCEQVKWRRVPCLQGSMTVEIVAAVRRIAEGLRDRVSIIPTPTPRLPRIFAQCFATRQGRSLLATGRFQDCSRRLGTLPHVLSIPPRRFSFQGFSKKPTAPRRIPTRSHHFGERGLLSRVPTTHFIVPSTGTRRIRRLVTNANRPNRGTSTSVSCLRAGS